MSPSDDDVFSSNFHVVKGILGCLCVITRLVSHKGVSSWLASLWPRAMEQEVKLFDFSMYLNKFQELVPVDKQTVNYFLVVYRRISIRSFVNFRNILAEKLFNTYSLILRSKFPTHSRLSSRLFDLAGSKGSGICRSDCEPKKLIFF